MKYDLHSHSNYSDGDLSPAELVAEVNEAGISHFALTDHDSLAGLIEARIAAEQYGIVLIDGVELSCTWRGQLLHIVALGIDPESEVLRSGIRANQEKRNTRAKAMLDDLKSNGIDIELELDKVLNGAIPTRPHFAQALINQGHAKNKQKAFKKFLIKGKPGYVEMRWPSLSEIGSWVSAASGVAVLAHPMRYKMSRTKLVQLIQEMKECGIEGIEVSTANNKPQQTKMLEDLAIEHELFASIGSDFHSPSQPWARLGSAPELSTRLEPVWRKLKLKDN